MRRCIPIALIFISGMLTLHSQSDFILAGQDTGLMRTNVLWGYLIPHIANVYDSYYVGTVYLDLNNDGVNDLQIGWEWMIGCDINIEYLYIKPEQEGIQLLCGYDTGIDYYNCNQRIYQCSKAYSSGDTIRNETSTWLDSTETIFYSYWDCACIGCCYDPIQNNLQTDSNYYIAGRMINNSDTSLFYLHLGANYAYMLYDYAIEGMDTSITTFLPTSVTDVTRPQTTRVYPNPFTNQIVFTGGKSMEFAICDYLGRTVMSGKSERIINTAQLIPGVYVLILKDEQNYLSTRIVKE